MIVTPHPDDAEFTAAGAVALWVRGGWDVTYVVCTNGNKGTVRRDLQPDCLARLRVDEQRAAASILGVRGVVFLGHADQELEETADFRKELVRMIRCYKPDVVVTDDPHRRYEWWHRDHRIAGRVTLDAVFPYARDRLAYADLIAEGLEPHKVAKVMLWGSEEPNYRVNVADLFDIKLRALRCHQTQVGHIPVAELDRWMRDWAREMAAGEAFELAEAFRHLDTPA